MNKNTTINISLESRIESSLTLYSQNTIGDKIKLVRIESGLTYNNFAKLLHIGTMTLSRYERNLRIPNKELLSNIISIFNLNKNFFNITINRKLLKE